MNTQVASILAALAALALSFAAGLWLGRRLRKRPGWRYWVANVIGVVIGIAIAAWGIMAGQQWVWVAGVAWMAGAITGLKYGLGKVVGQWHEPDLPLPEPPAQESDGDGAGDGQAGSSPSA